MKGSISNKERKSRFPETRKWTSLWPERELRRKALKRQNQAATATVNTPAIDTNFSKR